MANTPSWVYSFGASATVAAPTVSAVSTAGGTVGDLAGLYAATLTGTNLTGATGVTFNGLAATSVVVVNATTITCVVPSGGTTPGTASVLAMTAGGTNAANALFEYYSPAQEALTMWQRASYTGSPWTANASAGTSAANGSFTEATNPATAGTALNGRTPASFDGTAKLLTSANTLATYVSATAFSVTVLVKPATPVASPTAGAGYNEPAILGESAQGYWYLTYTTGGVKIGHRDTTAGAWVEATQACTSGAWHLVHAWFDGVNISISIDSVAATIVASTNQELAATGAIRMGKGFSAFAPCDVAEVIMSATNLGATSRSKLKSYVNTRYALAL